MWLICPLLPKYNKKKQDSYYTYPAYMHGLLLLLLSLIIKDQSKNHTKHFVILLNHAIGVLVYIHFQVHRT